MKQTMIVGGLILAVLGGGCSIKKMAVNGMAGSMAKASVVYARDNDPELIRHALPFALKTTETLLEEVPENRGLLLTACSGFTQYGYGFIQLDADMIEFDDFETFKKAASRWSLEFKQLDSGRFYGDITLLDSPQVQIGTTNLNRKLDQRGITPAGYRTFIIPKKTAF